MKEKILSWILLILKTYALAKDLVHIMKRQDIDQEKIFAKHLLDKRLVAKI